MKYFQGIRSSKFTFLLFVLFLSISCQDKTEEKPGFLGEEEAILRAEEMFIAIGGKEAWCRLKSLYIKAEHTEPQMSIPYQSEIWREIDEFELVIEQQNDSFHVKAVIDRDGGTIRYLDKRDTIRILDEDQLRNWEYNHDHNVYVLLHKLGCNPQDYTVELDEEGRLAFYRDTVFVTSFGLDESSRPHLFYSPSPDGKINGSRFTHWGTDGGLVHSAGGHPLDSNFVYRTKIWQPSEEPLKNVFGEEIFEIE